MLKLLPTGQPNGSFSGTLMDPGKRPSVARKPMDLP